MGLCASPFLFTIKATERSDGAICECGQDCGSAKHGAIRGFSCVAAPAPEEKAANADNPHDLLSEGIKTVTEMVIYLDVEKAYNIMQ